MQAEKHPFITHDKFIQWNKLNPKYIEKDILYAITLAQKNIDQIARLPLDKLTFDNVVLGMEFASDKLNGAWGLVCHLDGVVSSDDIRDAINKVLPSVSAFVSSIILNDDLWLRIKTYSQSEEAKHLNNLQKRLLQDLVGGFVDSGADLPKDVRDELKNIQLELAQLTKKFGENVLDARNAWEKYVNDKKDLSGLPETVIAVMRNDAKNHKKDGYRISLSNAISGPCMCYLDSENLRKEIFEAMRSMCHGDKFDNTQNVERILELRDKKIKILNFQSYADCKLKHRMAKNGSVALNFINDLHDKIFDSFLEEVKELEQFQTTIFKNKTGRLNPWDAYYLSEKLCQHKFDFKADELRKYFSIEDVLGGIFNIVNKLYGVTFHERKTCYSEDENAKIQSDVISVWHPEVKVFDVLEENGSYVGSFYMDLYPRANKDEGAWAGDIYNGGLNSNREIDYPIGVVCANLTPSTNDNPSLLTHGEVETIFHEFGHLLHCLFGKVEYKSMNGCSVAWDFVELPSQIMENFCWDHTSINLFAKDYKTGEKIPQDLFDKMIAARNHMSALVFMRQLNLSKMDLELHQNYKNFSNKNLEKELKNILSTYSIEYSVPVPTILNCFSHIFGGGYAAGYYSYKWAELLDADAFTKFKKNGVLSRATGQQFRDCILSKGDSEDADVLYRNFMGRDPQAEPLLERSGLLKK